MFMAFLQKKNLCNSEMLSYIIDYWDDIIKLVQNPLGEDQREEDEIIEPERYHKCSNLDSEHVSLMENRQSQKTNSLGS